MGVEFTEKITVDMEWAGLDVHWRRCGRYAVNYSSQGKQISSSR